MTEIWCSFQGFSQKNALFCTLNKRPDGGVLRKIPVVAGVKSDAIVKYI